MNNEKYNSLLEEVEKRRDKAKAEVEDCGNGLSAGVYKGKELAWGEALGLIKEYTEYADENLEGEE